MVEFHANRVVDPGSQPQPGLGIAEVDKKQQTTLKAALEANKITHVPWTLMGKKTPVWERILRATDIDVLVGHVINKFSILRGSLKKWDETRLLAGKHATFSKAGAEHLHLQTKYGDIVDATYLSAGSFASKLEHLGGKRVQFKPRASETDLYESEKVTVKLKDGSSFEGLKIDAAKALQKTEYDLAPIESYYKAKKMVVIQGEGGEMYAIPMDVHKKLSADGSIDQENILQKEVSEESAAQVKVGQEEAPLTFNGFYFEKNSPALKELLDGLEIGKTQWILRECGDKAFLVRRSDAPSIDLCAAEDPDLGNLEMKEAKELDQKSFQDAPTVMLSMNQTEVYEQYVSEFLTFALEGVNVIAYNNGGKGLSEGRVDTEGINQSLETVYQYLSNVKQVKDENIIAKGQCFGGAPSAWLGRQHPKINLMIDQSPANFFEIAAREMKKRFNFRSAVLNFIIDGLAKAIMAKYDTPANIRQNRGHKIIHHNIPSRAGTGGDNLVSDEHVDANLKAFEGVKGKQTKVSFNPGGVHVCHWFGNPRSFDQVMGFFHNAHLYTDLYEFEEPAAS